MDNYITLEHLDQTVWSLIQKNSQLRDEISAVDEKVNNINITESDPIFSASPVAHITNDDIDYWDSAARSLNSYMQKGIDYVTAGKKSGTSLGSAATAEGYSTTASGLYSHAEGSETIASNNSAHAEGKATMASGNHSHAEGVSTTASGNYSHAEGGRTKAQRAYQHVFGCGNIADTTGSTTADFGQYIEIVGNSKTYEDSNARTLDWSGNEWLAGKLTVGAGPTNNMDVATKQYVDAAIPTVPTKTSELTNDSGFITNDEKLKTYHAWLTSDTTLYPIVDNNATNTTASTKASYNFISYNYEKINNRNTWVHTIGSPSSQMDGAIRLRYWISSQSFYYTDIIASNLTKNNTITLPSSSGTLALTTQLPTKISQLTNDSGYITSVPVTSVNGKTGAVSLNVTDINAVPALLNTNINDQTIDSKIQHSAGIELVVKDKNINNGISLYMSPTHYLSIGNPKDIYVLTNGVPNGAIVVTDKGENVYIRNLTTPTNSTDAANKAYVDNSIAAIDIPENTDELVKIESKSGTNFGASHVLFGPSSGTTTIMSGDLLYLQTMRALAATKEQKFFQLEPGELILRNGDYGIRLMPADNITATQICELPNASGTLALVSDITNAIAGITSFNASVVATLPTTDIDTHTIYFISKTGSTNDVYDEYMYINDAWEKIGNTAVDLSGYIQSSQLADWAKASTKPSYTASEVGALPDTTVIPDISGKVDKSGDTMSGNLTFATGKGIVLNYNGDTNALTLIGSGSNSRIASFQYLTELRNIGSVTTNTSAANKQYVDNKVASITVPTKLSDLTNDTGYITSYTETDPVFAASAAAGITSTDINNWNAKVSDDKTWNGVSLDKTWSSGGAAGYVYYVTSTDATSAKYYPVSSSSITSANAIPKYDSAGHLRAYTPTVGDNSTYVATTAYVTTAISNIDIPALEPVANVEAMLTSLGLAINLNLTAAATGTAETGHAVVQEG